MRLGIKILDTENHQAILEMSSGLDTIKAELSPAELVDTGELLVSHGKRLRGETAMAKALNKGADPEWEARHVAQARSECEKSGIEYLQLYCEAEEHNRELEKEIRILRATEASLRRKLQAMATEGQ